MPLRPPPYQRTLLRQWREHRGRTLEQAAETVGITHASLSRIERGKQPYSQVILEALAEYYDTDVVSLLIRDPQDPEGIWSVWDQAKPREKRLIIEIARTLLRTRD
jgi:transcriptional regulator with XRE-family HTH domain